MMNTIYYSSKENDKTLKEKGQGQIWGGAFCKIFNTFLKQAPTAPEQGKASERPSGPRNETSESMHHTTKILTPEGSTSSLCLYLRFAAEMYKKCMWFRINSRECQGNGCTIMLGIVDKHENDFQL